MAKQVPTDRAAVAGGAVVDGLHEAAPDIAWQRLAVVNVAYVGAAGSGDGSWTLIDTGIPGSASEIAAAAERRFGRKARPAAIIVTHGHFDHVGALEELADRWRVPVFAHPLEVPYLDGSASYPPADPTVGGGMMSALSRFYPRGPIDVSRWLHTLPADNTVPSLPGWQWLHTPGHTPGHVSLWRAADRTLIAGDAFITTAQESAYAVAMQRPELHGPPMYYTQDWNDARASVQRLAALEPATVITGHGRALRGEAMRAALRTLARNFDRIAVPQQGLYVDTPARADDGSAYRSP